jgi:hypothetical protein
VTDVLTLELVGAALAVVVLGRRTPLTVSVVVPVEVAKVASPL